MRKISVMTKVIEENNNLDLDFFKRTAKTVLINHMNFLSGMSR